MSAAPAVVAAKARAADARARIDENIAELRARLSPKTVAHKAWADTVDRSADAWDSVVQRGTEGLALAVDQASRTSETATAFARRNPGIVTAAGSAALALLLGPSLVRRVLRPSSAKPIENDPPRLRGPIPHLEIRP